LGPSVVRTVMRQARFTLLCLMLGGLLTACNIPIPYPPRLPTAAEMAITAPGPTPKALVGLAFTPPKHWRAYSQLGAIIWRNPAGRDFIMVNRSSQFVAPFPDLLEKVTAIHVCGTYPAFDVERTAIFLKFNRELVYVRVGSGSASALYVYPKGVTPDPAGIAAIHTLCPRRTSLRKRV
jgi:hypothetical protein